MAEERLHFSDSALGCNAMSAAEHIVRYHCVRDICRGKRVLDVACGEGYGSALLAEWGASQIVGVDVSISAIDVAQRLFARPNIRFLQGDACRLAEVLGDSAPFDLVVSFETIEHVSDVPGLLSGIQQYRASDSAAVISCPNDHVEEETNPYHMRLYTFDEFRDVTAAVLGEASGWLFGTPAHGQLIYPAGDPVMENSKDSRRVLLTRCRNLGQAAVLPSQPNIAPSASNCRFYIGCWGCNVGTDAVMSPQSYPAFAEPWRAVTYFKQERDRLLSDQDGLRATRSSLERQLADLRRRMIVHARLAQSELAQSSEKLAQLSAELDRANADREHWRAVQASRTYRLMQAYVHGYNIPLIGPVLRQLRSVAGRTMRRTRMLR